MDIMLRKIDQYVLQGQDLDELPQFMCVQLVELLGYHLAWIGRKDHLHRALAGICTEYQEALTGSAQCSALGRQRPPLRGNSHTQRPTAGHQRCRYRLPAVACLCSPLRTAIRHCHPAHHHGEIYGTFSLYSETTAAFDDSGTVQRLAGIAGRISMALEWRSIIRNCAC